MRIADLAGQRVAIWGYGREGRAAVAALARRLPGLRPTLFCSDDEKSLAETTGTDLRIVTTAPQAADLATFDVVIKSPGISAYRPEILDARRNGTRFTSATALWFAEHPEARTIAVTGSKGKSTTTALIAHLLRGLGHRVALAGNIGMPVLELLDPRVSPDWWVIELSSFQTRDTSHVDVGVITNLDEEHLDWHGDRDRYAADKLALADAATVLVINARHGELVRRTATHAHRQVFGDAFGWNADAATIQRGGLPVFDLGDFALAGPHNALNACAALAAVEAAGEDARGAVAHLATFRPLPHRLQVLGTRAGIVWIDDSIATTPQSAIEALRTLGGHEIALILGGHERGLDWHGFAAAVRAHPPRTIIVNGANAMRIAEVLHTGGDPCPVQVVATLADAVALARREINEGGTVLLSPGAPSFDQFRDYAERGRAFAALAGFDPDAIGQIEGLGIA